MFLYSQNNNIEPTFFFKEPVADYVQAVVNTALNIHKTEEPGDILAFLTGLEEVDRAVSLLSEHARIIKDGERTYE